MSWYDGEKEIFVPQEVVREKVRYPESIFLSWSAEELAAIGIYPVVDTTYDTVRYSAKEAVYTIVENKAIKTYTVQKRTLEEVKKTALDIVDMRMRENQRPNVQVTVSGGRTIVVNGGREDKDNFESEYGSLIEEKKAGTVIIDANNGFHQVLTEDVKKIYLAIFANGKQAIFKKHADRAKIAAAKTVQEALNVVGL